MGNEPIRSYRDLRVWQAAINLTEACYRASSGFPRAETFGLTAQLRRAAVSVPANIAEGYGRESAGSYTQYLRIAQGSLKELGTHLILSQRLGLASGTEAEPLLEQCATVGKMLRALIRSVEKSDK